MRIGIYASSGYVHPDFTDAISGHLQTPFVTAKMLSEHGHHVELITTQHKKEYVLPRLLPDEVDVIRLTEYVRSWPESGRRPVHALVHVGELMATIARSNLDILHFFGSRQTAYLASLLKHVFPSKTFVLTIVQYRDQVKRVPQKMNRALLGKLNLTLASTTYMAKNWEEHAGYAPKEIRHGVLKDLYSKVSWEENEPKRNDSPIVLFWRNANRTNGADICADAFSRLAKSHRNVEFVFAVRPNDELEDQLRSLASDVSNIGLFLYPYKQGITLENLMSRAVCVALPFRRLSINPQMAVLESMCAGLPVVTTSVESNAELMKDGDRGLLVRSEDSDQLQEAVSRLITDRELGRRLGRNARRYVEEKWNWTRYYEALYEMYESVC